MLSNLVDHVCRETVDWTMATRNRWWPGACSSRAGCPPPRPHFPVKSTHPTELQAHDQPEQMAKCQGWNESMHTLQASRTRPKYLRHYSNANEHHLLSLKRLTAHPGTCNISSEFNGCICPRINAKPLHQGFLSTPPNQSLAPQTTTGANSTAWAPLAWTPQTLLI